MWMPDFQIRRVIFALACTALLSLPAVGQPNTAPKAAPTSTSTEHALTADELRLAAGEILVNAQEISGIKYVVAKVWIDQTPEKTWPTLVNPFEFERGICRRMKKVDVLTDQPTVSLLDCTIGVIFPIPDFKYVVESHYTACDKVEFHRVSGSFKDFRGFWGLRPVAQGTKTEVTYSMYIDPGFPVPDWLVRQGVRCELPSVLVGLRDRVNYLKQNADAAEKRTIAAATGFGAQTTAVTAKLP